MRTFRLVKLFILLSLWLPSLSVLAEAYWVSNGYISPSIYNRAQGFDSEYRKLKDKGAANIDPRTIRALQSMAR